MRRLNSLWSRLWAGWVGRTFFRVAGAGVKKPARAVLPSPDRTELVLGRAAVDVFEDLPGDVRRRLRDVPQVVRRLERDAEALRERGDTGERLATTVAALESVRLGLLRLQAGTGTLEDLTLHLERAKEIGEAVDAELAARREVREVLKGPP